MHTAKWKENSPRDDDDDEHDDKKTTAAKREKENEKIGQSWLVILNASIGHVGRASFRLVIRSKNMHI